MSNLKETIQQIFDDPNFKHTKVSIVSDAAPQRNGVGAYYFDLGQYLEIALEDLVVIAPEIRGDKWIGGIAVQMPGDPTQKFMIPNPFSIWRQMKKQRPNVVIIPTPGLYGVIGAICGRLLGAKVLIGFHTWFEKLTDLYWDKFQGNINLFYFKVSNGILFKLGHSVFANSEHMVDIANEQGAKKCELVGTPLSYDFADAPIVPGTGKLKRILFAGRLAAEKNLESIILAAENHPDLEFSFIGDGIQRGLIEEAAERLNNINYLGWRSRLEVMNEIDAHDALVLPSIVESFGTIALEAMARARFTIVSTECGITQWPELCAGMSIIPKESDLSDHLHNVKNLTEDEVGEKCQIGLEKAVELNHWSLGLWQKLLLQASKK